MPVSEAQRKASVKYLEKLDEIRIRMPKGRKDEIKDHAAAVGESVNGYIVEAINRRMEAETPSVGDTQAGPGVVSFAP